MLSKKEIITLIVTFLVLFGLGALIYTPRVQSQLAEESREQLKDDSAKRFANLQVKFRGQDAHLSGSALNQEDLDAAIKLVGDVKRPIRFRGSGENAVRKVHTDDVKVGGTAAPATAPANNLEPGSQPFVTVAAYGDKVLRVDGTVGSAGVKVQLKESLHRRYPGYRVDDKNVKTTNLCSPPRNARDVNQLPILKTTKDSFFAAGMLDGKWKVFDGKSVARGATEQVLSSEFPAHDPPMNGLQALIDWRNKKPIVVASNPQKIRSTTPANIPKRPATPTPTPITPGRVTRMSIPPKPTPVLNPKTIRSTIPKPPAINVVPLKSTSPFKPFPADTAIPSTPTKIIPPTRPPVVTRPPTRPNPVKRTVPVAPKPIPTIVKATPKPPPRVTTPPRITPTPPRITPTPPRRVTTPTKPPVVVAVPKARPLGRLTFETGASSLSDDQKNYGLRLVKRIIASRPKATFEVVGHTDSQGAEASNLAMSRKRAEAVKSFLVSSGVPAGKVTVVGKGESAPLADNNTADGRRQNRRVEIIATF